MSSRPKIVLTERDEDLSWIKQPHLHLKNSRWNKSVLTLTSGARGDMICSNLPVEAVRTRQPSAEAASAWSPNIRRPTQGAPNLSCSKRRFNPASFRKKNDPAGCKPEHNGLSRQQPEHVYELAFMRTGWPGRRKQLLLRWGCFFCFFFFLPLLISKTFL